MGTLSRIDGPIKITISDPETGAVFSEKVIHNDYALITNGTRYVKNIQVMGRTHMIAVATKKAGES